jgi:hypothetical protein
VGHLGIFVSGGVARKEHSEFSSNIDLIDLLPPGLYEATFERKGVDTANPDLSAGDWVMRCEQRTLDDIRALGGNDPADDRCFAAAAKVSETNLALYRAYFQPFVRALANPVAAEWLQKFHPLRLSYELFSDANPINAMLKPLTKSVREHRQPAAADNPFIVWQGNLSKQVVATLDAWRDARDTLAEQTFFAIYGSPALQAAVGLDPTSSQPLRKPEKDPLHQELLQTRIAEHKSRIAVGGMREALVRALLYVGTGRGAVDERGFEAVRRFRREQTQMPGLPLSEFKTLVREQFFMLTLDQEAALSAIPSMLPRDKEARHKAFENLKQVLSSIGQLDAEDEKRLSRVADLFEIDDSSQAPDGTVAFPRQRQRSKGGQANNSGEDSTSRRDNAS